MLAEGIALVQQGDFEAAVLKLDEASRRLAADPARRPPSPPAAGIMRPLADAYLYLGISYLELNQELNARAKFREVLKVEPTRKLSDRVFSPQIIRVFEAARVEMFPNEKKKRSVVPFLWIAGGGAASAGVYLATTKDDEPTTTAPAETTTTTLAGTGGGNPTTTSTTLATDPGTPTTTTTTTTSTTLPGTPTTSSTSTTSTTTSTTSSTTTTTTTSTTSTTMPVCTYTLAPDAQFNLLGGPGSCLVTTQAGCAWSASSDSGWLSITGGASGTGNGTIAYTVAAVPLPLERTGRISLAQAPGARCEITQKVLAVSGVEGGLRWEGTLDVDGGRGQLVFDGVEVSYQDQGIQHGIVTARTAGPRQVVAQLIAAKGRPGTWTFRLPGTVRPGSLRPLVGTATQVTADAIAFRLTGKPGERIVFTWDALP